MLHDAFEHGRIGVGRDAVAKVEDVTRMTGVALQDRVDLRRDDLPRSAEDRRVEVALQGPVGGHAPTGLGEGNPPVHADDVGPCLCHQRQEFAGAHPEVDAGHTGGTDGLEHLRARRHGVSLVVGGGQRARPRVEQLDRFGAVGDLRLQRGDGQIRQAIHEGKPQLGVALHHDLGVVVRPGRPTLDQVAGHREGCAGKADERDVEFGDEVVDGLEHVRRVGLRIQRPQAGQIVRAGERLLDHRADARHHVHAEADGVDGGDDVGVEDGGIDAVAAHGLERDLRAQIRIGDGVVDAALAADGAVFGQRTSRLTHEPDGGDLVGFAAAGGEEGGVGASGHHFSVGDLAELQRSTHRVDLMSPQIAGDAVIHPDLTAEQAAIDHAYQCLEEARVLARKLSSTVEVGAGGTNQARFEREAFTENIVDRLAQLDIGDASLVFGRIDHDEDGHADSLYVGRVGVWDRAQDPVVVDWRAPASEPFYRATGVEPLGLSRRRHFASRGPILLDIDDELFGDLSRLDEQAQSGSGIQGHGALITALETARTGRLGDIVATIQGEQDEIIRSPLPGVLVVQGGPGTGKTVVALHRAAYLLYTHRFPLQDQGVLVIGPNRLFLGYIEQVLPSLGEAGVRLAVLSDLVVPRVRTNVLDSEDVAEVKGDLRMVALVRRAVRQRERALRDDFSIGYGLQTLRVSRHESESIIHEARRRYRTHNAARRFVEDEFFAALANSARDEVEATVVRERIRWTHPVREALEWMWPVLSPPQLIQEFYGSRALLRSAGRGLFTTEQVDRLHRPRTTHSDDVIWSFADAPVLDEARANLGFRPGKKQADEVRTHGHIVVDEAQDLSPMALRMVARRSLNGSMTIVGDIAQATGSWAHDSWEEVLELLPEKRPPSRRELHTGYRIPAPAMELAAKVLTVAAPDLEPPIAIRNDGDPPVVQAATDLRSDLPAMIRTELERIGSGNVAVIVPRSLEDDVADWLTAEGIEHGGATRSGLHQQVTLIPVSLVKGLETDAAIVVEPSRIVREERQGMRSLYVALTRATKRVNVLHAEPLPAVLQR